jgi:hypothetical protein
MSAASAGHTAFGGSSSIGHALAAIPLRLGGGGGAWIWGVRKCVLAKRDEFIFVGHLPHLNRAVLRRPPRKFGFGRGDPPLVST